MLVKSFKTQNLFFSSVHESAINLPPPVRVTTPYGGQLRWTLPGGTPLIVHLKDKNKIRIKKRWSQVSDAKGIIFTTGNFKKSIHPFLEYFVDRPSKATTFCELDSKANPSKLTSSEERLSFK